MKVLHITRGINRDVKNQNVDMSSLEQDCENQEGGYVYENKVYCMDNNDFSIFRCVFWNK